ncbi:MAG: hypothetical protein MUO26_09755, partial [Methanotrichaceae archaeon]|nr:hypothetical protein [Methanotrichaceae archaeon]
MLNSNVHDNVGYMGAGLCSIAGNFEAMISATALLNVQDCNFYRNVDSIYGIVWNLAELGNATASVQNSNVYNNFAGSWSSQPVGIINSAFYGDATLSVQNSNIYHNHGGYGISNEAKQGKAIINIENCRINGNIGSPYGGGGVSNEAKVKNAQAIVIIKKSNIYNNTAEYGGGIYNRASANSTALVTVIDSDIFDNIANGGGGGSLTARCGGILNQADDNNA